MAHKMFVGDTGTKIILDVTQNISDATVLQIKYKKPNGQIGTWAASLESRTKLAYVTNSTDIDVSGDWIIQAYVSTPSWTGLGESIYLKVLDPFTFE